MSQYHSILFYTSHPDDKISLSILDELKKYPELKDQIRLICVSNPNLTLPKMIVELDTFPVIVTRGFEEPIMGEHALSWIKESHFSGRANGYQYGDIDKAEKTGDDFGSLATESSKTEYHQPFNDDWNRDGVDQTPHILNSSFSNINETQQSVDTFEEGDKKGMRRTDQEMRRLQMQRQQEVPPPLRRMDGPGAPGLQNLPPFDPRSSSIPPPESYNNPLANPRPPPYGGFPGMGQQGPGPAPGRRFPDPRGNFPPQPPNNPMIPQHPGSMQPPPGNAFPPQVAGPQASGSGGNVPVMPTGFGAGVSLNDAYGGMSLLGHTPINNQFSTRREQSIIPGLPTGRGRMGPSQTGTNTRSYP